MLMTSDFWMNELTPNFGWCTSQGQFFGLILQA